MKNFFNMVLEIIFPSSLTEKRVRKMTFEDFAVLKNTYLNEEDKVLSLFEYKNLLIREAIKLMKYRRDKGLAKIFAELIYSEILEELSDFSLFEGFENPILVGVPMSKKERKERGYNQVEILVKEISDISDFDYDFNILKKIKDTKRQTNLKREERLKNIFDVFEASPEVRGKNIILVDDVMTTGSTINEARRVLEKEGAKIFVVVIAR